MKLIYEYAIQKEVLNSGKEIFTPVVRRKKRWKWGWLGYEEGWQRIVRQYDRWVLLELDWDPELTYEQCQEHIDGYHKTLIDSVANEVNKVELHKLEEKTY